ncbi:MAG TPA: DUF4159 domain-containing protein [Tepidisphaeraceae bacterium]|jgi:hypothetical protein|nr:DUF4159 domain-containing protein [Tepidisphaeraceae bacterium]
MVFTTQCPQCGKILWFASNLTGKLTICPACGAVMHLTPPPQANPAPQPADPPATEQSAGSDSTPVQPPSDEQAPPAVEEAYLTHQAAAAMGDVHVEVEDSDLVQWTMQPAPPAEPPATPPAWLPTPLANFGLPQDPMGEQGTWFGPAVPSRINSLLPRSPARTAEEELHRRRTFVWGAGAVAIVVMIIAVLWLLQGAPPAVPTWEQANRDQILGLKQDAEQLAINGKYRAAYDKYQELERLVSGHAISDPFLQEELIRSWQRRDSLYDIITGARPPPMASGVARSPATAPAPARIPTSPAIAPPATEPSLDLSSVLFPTTRPQEAIQTPPPPPPPKRAAMPRPPAHLDIPPVTGITDAQIGASIEKGVDFLLQRFTGPQIAGNFEHYEGLDTLAVYALMQAELATGDKRLDIHSPFMTDAIDAVKKFPMVTDYITYARALRATALALYDRPQDHHVIREDVEWLLRSQEGGAFTYNNEFPRNSHFMFWDNSNSQYGLLGVWSGAEAGIPVPAQFWRDVREHWTKYQLPGGQWCYRADQNDPSRSMTLAGIASLIVAQDYLDAEDYGDQVGRPPFSPALEKALKWLEDGDNSVIALPSSADFYTYYALYGLERTGLASGFKYYGSHDWYRDCAAEIVAAQTSDGSWGSVNGQFDGIVNTSYSLLFLARGRHPVLMNKLRFAGDWDNRPRDVANLARFASAELERPLNWQIVSVDRPWLDWTDSPILYMASDKPPILEDQDRQKIKQYVENGGMLLTQADAGRPEFSRFVEDLGKQLFPQYPWIDLPDDSVLYSVSYHITDHPKIRVITNGSRILMMHWPTDLTHYWQLREERIGRSAFELGVNLALYAAGKSELKNRLDSDSIAAPSGPPAASIQLARLRYDGNWDPEPAAWPRAARWFRQQTDYDIHLEPTALENLAALNPPIAHMTGTGKLNPTADQLKSVKEYVENGGVLLIEPCGTPDAFLRSVHDDFLLHMFPALRVEPISDSNPMLTPSGNGMIDVSHPDVRQFVRSYTDITDMRPMMATEGQGHIIILPLDMTSGLLGADAWGIAGYQSEYALELMKNIVLWVWDGAKDEIR